MNTEDRIANTEYVILLHKDFLNLLIKTGQHNMVLEIREKIKDLEKALEHDREVQKIETSVSGRKTWKDDAWKYVLVSIGTIIVVEVVRWILSKL